MLRYLAAVVLMLLAPLPLGAESAPDTITMDGGGPLVSTPFKLIDNRIFVDVNLGRHGPYQMVLDTGGGNGISITPEVAAEIGVTGGNAHPVTGAGAGAETGTTALVEDVHWGALHLRHQTVQIFSLQAIQDAMGFQHFDGVIGVGALARLIITIDYARERLTFMRPAAWHAAGARIPLRFEGVMPLVNLTLDGVTGSFLLDTGDRSSLSFSAAFAQDHGLLSHYGGHLHTTTGWGIGGPIPGWVFRVPQFAIGQVAVTDVVARIPTLKAGFFADPHFAGILGDGVLKRYRVTLDYPQHALYLEPRTPPVAHDEWDRAGVWLAHTPHGFRAADVIDGGPAAEAGLKVDDLVVKIDGQSTNGMLLPEVRDMLKQADRRTVVFTVHRDNQDVDRTLTLRDLL